LTGEVAHILITTAFNRYRMALGTSLSEAPAGAPITCKALGWVAFDDFAANKRFLGAKADLLYADISKHIHVRELTDALAAARREVAEAAPEKVGLARVRLAEVADKAKKWGIEAKVPDGPVAAVPPPQVVSPSDDPAGAGNARQWCSANGAGGEPRAGQREGPREGKEGDGRGLLGHHNRNSRY
jgi:hypothetical protein